MSTKNKRIAAESRLDLELHFETLFERVIREHPYAEPSELAALVAKETVDWIEGYDEALAA